MLGSQLLNEDTFFLKNISFFSFLFSSSVLFICNNANWIGGRLAGPLLVLYLFLYIVILWLHKHRGKILTCLCWVFCGSYKDSTLNIFLINFLFVLLSMYMATLLKLRYRFENYTVQSTKSTQQRMVLKIKLDRVGPVDNRPSTDKLHQDV